MEGGENTQNTTQIEGEGDKKRKIEVYGKILETSTPEAFLDRIMVKFSSPAPRVPLCRMIGTEAIRRVSPSTERSLTRSFNKMGGHIESKGTFID